MLLFFSITIGSNVQLRLQGATLRDEIVSELSDRIKLRFALKDSALTALVNQANLDEALNMMSQGRWRDIEISLYFPNRQPFFTCSDEEAKN